MAGTVSIEHLRNVPYLDVSKVGDRAVHIMPLWDGDEWRVWIPTPDGKLLPVHVANTVRADYVAKTPADESDVFVPFIDMAWQHLSWPELVPHLLSIIQDVHCLAASWSKLDLFYRERENIGTGVGVLAGTELDYLFVLARSVFDRLQAMIATVWNGRVRLLDEKAEARRASRTLPKEFRKVVLVDEKPQTAAAIEAKFGLTPAMAEIYERYVPFFRSVRSFRDRVVHGTGIKEMIFVTERGFCVEHKSKAFRDFAVWNDASKFNRNLSSLLALVADVITQTIDCCNLLVGGFLRQIQMPPEIAPNYRVFTRGYHTSALIQALQISKGGSPWPAEAQFGKVTQ